MNYRAMYPQAPIIGRKFVIADDAQLAAQVCGVLAKQGEYLAVVDGPRLSRLDADAEIIRRNNAAARVLNLRLVVHAGLSDASHDAMSATLSTLSWR